MQFPKNDEAVTFFRANGYGKTYNDGLNNWLYACGYTARTLTDKIRQATKDGFSFALEVPGE
jgi:hypothetical protein